MRIVIAVHVFGPVSLNLGDPCYTCLQHRHTWSPFPPIETRPNDSPSTQYKSDITKCNHHHIFGEIFHVLFELSAAHVTVWKRYVRHRLV
jgi:hypothetical protein